VTYISRPIALTIGLLLAAGIYAGLAGSYVAIRGVRVNVVGSLISPAYADASPDPIGAPRMCKIDRSNRDKIALGDTQQNSRLDGRIRL
jgi:hypothetical protein